MIMYVAYTSLALSVLADIAKFFWESHPENIDEISQSYLNGFTLLALYYLITKVG